MKYAVIQRTVLDIVLVYHIIVMLIQYCQIWSRIGNKLGQNDSEAEQETEKLEQNLFRLTKCKQLHATSLNSVRNPGYIFI